MYPYIGILLFAIGAFAFFRALLKKGPQKNDGRASINKTRDMVGGFCLMAAGLLMVLGY